YRWRNVSGSRPRFLRGDGATLTLRQMRNALRLLLGFLLAIAADARAAGYVDDAACAGCHADRFASFQHVGMAKSFFAPRPQDDIEDFAAPPFFHARSQQYFEMRRQAGSLLFRRYQL